jgi:hypothetical protein
MVAETPVTFSCAVICQVTLFVHEYTVIMDSAGVAAVVQIATHAVFVQRRDEMAKWCH